MEKYNKTSSWKLMRAHGKAKKVLRKVVSSSSENIALIPSGSCFVRRDLLLFGPRADPPLSVPLIITFASAAAGDTDIFCTKEPFSTFVLLAMRLQYQILHF